MTWKRCVGYLWASPVTGCALCVVLLGRITGGRAGVVWGVVEIHGGLVTWCLRKGSPWFGPIAAMTLGHVILGRDGACLDHSREHEHVHVRQYERWGPFFIPAYLAASLWCWCRGFDAYFDNPFECEAFEEDEKRRAG